MFADSACTKNKSVAGSGIYESHLQFALQGGLTTRIGLYDRDMGDFIGTRCASRIEENPEPDKDGDETSLRQLVLAQKIHPKCFLCFGARGRT